MPLKKQNFTIFQQKSCFFIMFRDLEAPQLDKSVYFFARPRKGWQRQPPISELRRSCGSGRIIFKSETNYSRYMYLAHRGGPRVGLGGPGTKVSALGPKVSIIFL